MENAAIDWIQCGDMVRFNKQQKQLRLEMVIDAESNYYYQALIINLYK